MKTPLITALQRDAKTATVCVVYLHVAGFCLRNEITHVGVEKTRGRGQALGHLVCLILKTNDALQLAETAASITARGDESFSDGATFIFRHFSSGCKALYAPA